MDHTVKAIRFNSDKKPGEFTENDCLEATTCLHKQLLQKGYLPVGRTTCMARYHPNKLETLVDAYVPVLKVGKKLAKEIFNTYKIL